MPREAQGTCDVLQEAQDTRAVPREVQDTHDVPREVQDTLDEPLEAQRLQQAAFRWPSTCTYAACLRAGPRWCHAGVTLVPRRLAPPPGGTPVPACDWLGSPSWLKKGARPGHHPSESSTFPPFLPRPQNELGRDS